MARVYKVEMYLLDCNDFLEYGSMTSELEKALYRLDLSSKIHVLKKSDFFEFEDDLEINYVEATTEDFEVYVKNKPNLIND